MPHAENGRSQRGAAIITALLVTALAAALAASLLVDMDDWLEHVALSRDKAVSRALAYSAIDYARAVLADDARHSAVDTAEEQWSRVLPPITAEGSELQGRIFDLQGHWNLNNLSRSGVIDETALAVYRQLLIILGTPPETAEQLAEALADWIDSDDSRRAVGAENAYYLALDPPYPTAGHELDQLSNLLRIKGYTPALVDRLSPYVAVLPGRQPVNVNTAAAEVLLAIQPGLDLASARQLVLSRQAAYFRDIADFRNRLPTRNLPEGATPLTVSSSYFLASASARINPPSGVQSRLLALLHRPTGGRPSLLWMSEQ